MHEYTPDLLLVLVGHLEQGRAGGQVQAGLVHEAAAKVEGLEAEVQARGHAQPQDCKLVAGSIGHLEGIAVI